VPRDLTSAELLVLGLLAERPRHGYDLDQVITERGMREWTAVAFSSLYYLLGRLEADGLVARLTPDGDRRRRTYTLTDLGRQLTVEATTRALSSLAPAHPPVLVGVANLPLLDRAVAAEALRERGRAITAELDRLRTHRDRQVPGAPPVVGVLFDHALSALDAELGWVLRTVDSLEDRHDQG